MSAIVFSSAIKKNNPELLESKNSEREGRAIDKDQIGSMEKTRFPEI